MKYEKLSREIIEAVGGKDNILTVQHCITRLRFTLNDNSKADDEKIKKIDGVLSLVKQGGQYQVVIGTYVHDVYLDVCQIIGYNKNEPQEQPKKKTNILTSMFQSLLGTVGPIIPILISTGLGKCILILLTQFGLVDPETSFTYYVFNFVFDCGFAFMPVFVSIAAAKHFKCNIFIAALLGCALVHPNWNSIVSQVNPRFVGDMFGFLPVYGIPYTSSLIPALLMTWVLSKVEKKLNKILPEMIKGVFLPLLLVLIMVPLTFVVIAPLMGILSIYVGNAIMWLYNRFGMIGLAVMAMLYPWLVITGMHSTLAIAGIQVLSQSGYDPFSRTLTLTANMAQGASSLACAIKTKNKEFRRTCLSASFTAFFAGITEPSIYGVTLRLKKPMIAVTIGSTCAGIYAGLVGLKAYAFMSASLINFPMWIGPDGTSNLVHAFIAMAISIVVTFVMTLILGFDDPKDSGKKKDEVIIEHDTINKINSPVDGTVIDLKNVKDEMFASEVLGKGIAIRPTCGRLYAPVDGTITAVFPTKHAIGITTHHGLELLIHIGIDTVKLDGRPFNQVVELGQKVLKGDLLTEFNMDEITKEGLDPTIMVVVTNSKQYLEILPTELGKVESSDCVLTVI